jgi:hypothetical protein
MDQQHAERAFYHAPRRCHRCNTTYTNHEALGRWQCREHWGIVRGRRFTCCGALAADDAHGRHYTRGCMAAAQRGCVRADHIEAAEDGYGGFEYEPYARLAERYPSEVSRRMLRSNGERLGCEPAAMHALAGDARVVVVLRYDAAAVARMRARRGARYPARYK